MIKQNKILKNKFY